MFNYVTQYTISSTCQRCLYVLISYNVYAIYTNSPLNSVVPHIFSFSERCTSTPSRRRTKRELWDLLQKKKSLQEKHLPQAPLIQKSSKQQILKESLHN